MTRKKYYNEKRKVYNTLKANKLTTSTSYEAFKKLSPKSTLTKPQYERIIEGFEPGHSGSLKGRQLSVASWTASVFKEGTPAGNLAEIMKRASEMVGEMPSITPEEVAEAFMEYRDATPKLSKDDSPLVAEWSQFIGDAEDMVQAIDDTIKNNKGEFDEEQIAELKNMANQIGDMLDELGYGIRKRKRKTKLGAGLKWRSV